MTHKVYDPQWAAPEGAKLVLEVYCERPNTLVVGLDESAAVVALEGGPQWQRLVLAAADFCNADDEAMEDWRGIGTLRLGAKDRLKRAVDGEQAFVELGGAWNGAAPAFRDLRWLIDSSAEEQG